MNELQLSEYVQKHGEEVTTTSRRVAVKFSRRHGDVLAIIRKLEAKLNERYFSPVTYIDEKGEARVEYEMDLKGYLAFGNALFRRRGDSCAARFYRRSSD